MSKKKPEYFVLYHLELDEAVKRYSEKDFWKTIETMYENIAGALLTTRWETKEDTTADDIKKRDFWIHRYRRTDDRDQHEYFLGWAIGLLDPVGKHISKRKITKEFAYDWARLNFCAGYFHVGLFASADETGRRIRGGRHTGKENDRTILLKWYLHWRRYYHAECRLPLVEANRLFRMAAWKIVKKKNAPPAGFSVGFFEKALGKNNWPNTLPNILKRALVDPRAKELLAQQPDEVHQIPPLDLKTYGLAFPEHLKK